MGFGWFRNLACILWPWRMNSETSYTISENGDSQGSILPDQLFPHWHWQTNSSF